MKIAFIFISVLALQTVTAQKTSSNITIDSLPESQIDIPIQLSLKPIYALAEKNVDTVFTSPGYPDGWVQSDCATRYKYHFRRSPLNMSMNGNTLQLAFFGLLPDRRFHQGMREWHSDLSMDTCLPLWF